MDQQRLDKSMKLQAIFNVMDKCGCGRREQAFDGNNGKDKNREKACIFTTVLEEDKSMASVGNITANCTITDDYSCSQTGTDVIVGRTSTTATAPTTATTSIGLTRMKKTVIVSEYDHNSELTELEAYNHEHLHACVVPQPASSTVIIANKENERNSSKLTVMGTAHDQDDAFKQLDAKDHEYRHELHIPKPLTTLSADDVENESEMEIHVEQKDVHVTAEKVHGHESSDCDFDKKKTTKAQLCDRCQRQAQVLDILEAAVIDLNQSVRSMNDYIVECAMQINLLEQMKKNRRQNKDKKGNQSYVCDFPRKKNHENEREGDVVQQGVVDVLRDVTVNVTEDVGEDVVEDVVQQGVEDVNNDLSNNVMEDVPQCVVQPGVQDVEEDIATNMVENLAEDWAEDLAEHGSKDDEKEALEDMAEDIAKNVEEAVVEDVVEEECRVGDCAILDNQEHNVVQQVVQEGSTLDNSRGRVSSHRNRRQRPDVVRVARYCMRWCTMISTWEMAVVRRR